MNRDKKIDIEPHLYRLKELDDYEVSDKDPDVRGWNVYSAEGVKFGKVDELIVDPEAMKVRYLDIEVDEGIEGVTEEHHLLVPVGVASLDNRDDKVFISTVQTVSLLKTPPYKGGVITRDYEDELRQIYFDEKLKTVKGENYYESEYYNEDRFYGSRRSMPSSDPGSLYLISASALFGEKIISGENGFTGRIEEIMLDIHSGKIAYAVFSFDDISINTADKYFAVPWEILKVNDSDQKLFINASKEKLINAPRFDKNNLSKTADRGFINQVYNYYGVKTYW